MIKIKLIVGKSGLFYGKFMLKLEYLNTCVQILVPNMLIYGCTLTKYFAKDL